MSKPHPAAPSTGAPVVPRVTRGVRAGEISTRAAANGAPASASFDAATLTFEFTLLTTQSCKSWRYILEDGARWPEYYQIQTEGRVSAGQGQGYATKVRRLANDTVYPAVPLATTLANVREELQALRAEFEAYRAAHP